jgi:hypothetical protein
LARSKYAAELAQNWDDKHNWDSEALFGGFDFGKDASLSPVRRMARMGEKL